MTRNKEIINKYPELFGKPPFEYTKSCLYFGLEVGDGWLGVLDKTFEKISKVVKELELSDFLIVQVKEKYAGLRIYCEPCTPKEVSVIIQEAEAICAHTCEICGSSKGKERGSQWVYIRCDTCEEKRTCL